MGSLAARAASMRLEDVVGVSPSDTPVSPPTADANYLAYFQNYMAVYQAHQWAVYALAQEQQQQAQAQQQEQAQAQAQAQAQEQQQHAQQQAQEQPLQASARPHSEQQLEPPCEGQAASPDSIEQPGATGSEGPTEGR